MDGACEGKQKKRRTRWFAYLVEEFLEMFMVIHGMHWIVDEGGGIIGGGGKEGESCEQKEIDSSGLKLR